MLGTIRYKYTTNNSGVAIPDAETFLEINGANDGNNKQFKVIRRVIRTGDTGTTAGQTRHANGLILDVIPKTYNVLAILGFAFRKSADDVGSTKMYPFDFLQNQITHSEGVVTGYSDIIFGLFPEDNSIRAIDKGSAEEAAETQLQVNDVLYALVVLGQADDSTDLLNYA